MRLGRPVTPLVLIADERETLERWARRPTTARALAWRARLVLRCAARESATAIARDVHHQTDRREMAWSLARTPAGWIARRAASRRAAENHRCRCGTRADLDAGIDTARCDALVRRGASPSIAGMSQTAVARIWKAFALQPHRVEPRRQNERWSSASCRTSVPTVLASS